MTAPQGPGASPQGMLRSPRSRRDILLGSAVVTGAALLLVGIAVRSRGVADATSDGPSPTGVVWSAEYPGFHCEVDEHRIVMSDEARVWALDLRDGRESWSVDVDGNTVGHDCLPDAGLVALSSFRDTGGAPRQDTRLLDPTSGEELWRFHAESAMRVLGLGAFVGLVDDQNLLTAFSPTDMNVPLWTRQMALPSEVMTHSDVERIDDEFVCVVFGIEGEADDVERRIVLRTADGTSPLWAPEPTQQYTLFDSHDGVILRWTGGEDDQRLIALDSDGRELWDARNAQALSIGSRLYVLDLAARYSGYTRIRLVDPRTGDTSAEVEQNCDWVAKLPGERIGLISDAHWISLDPNLVEENRQSMSNRIFEFADDGHLFVGEFIDGDWERVLALEVPSGDVVWQTDLVPDQRIDRIGKHLVTTDEDNGVIQGLEGPA